MKKHFIIATFLLTLFVGHGQTNVYHPFPDTNAVWRVNSWAGCAPSYISKAYQYYQYTMDGDTTIGLYHYKKIYKSGMSETHCYSAAIYEYFYVGGLRQDTANKTVYFCSPSCSDALIYDFNKQVGDSLLINSCFGFVEAGITSIDSVFVGNNYRKRLHLNASFGTISNTLIEGIGSS